MTMPAGWKPSNRKNNVGGQVDLASEHTIWRNEVMTGIIHRRVVEVQIITNQRVLQNDRAVFLKDLDDIVVMNQHRESQGQSARYYVRGFGTSYGTGRSSGKTIGDIVFLYQGQPTIIFKQIEDPYGVARLAKAPKKSAINAIKIAERIEAKAIKEREKALKLTQRSSQSYKIKSDEGIASQFVSESIQENEIIPNMSEMTCKKCGSSNPTDASFCGMCGAGLSPSCSKCGCSNPKGSSFCNKCGFALV